MKPLDHKTILRAHTPPHTPDGVALACALQVACYLAHQRQVSHIKMWLGASADARDVFATAISDDLLEPLLREGAVTSDGVQFELHSGEPILTPYDAVVLAICVNHADFLTFLLANPVGIAIYMPGSEEDLQAYVSATPDSNAIRWREEKSESHDPSGRTDELNLRLAWYREHYRVIEAGSLGGENGHVYAKHDGTGRCRYCGRSSPEVPFRSKSHAFPEQIGNKTLIDPAECDECNWHFGKMLDDDFAKWTQPWRTVLRVKGRSGIPTTRSRDQKMRIEAQDVSNLKLYVSQIDDHHMLDTDAQRLQLKVDRPAYVPMGVFKCLVKMAVSVMPAVYAAECDHLKKWILEASHTFESYPYRPLTVLLQLIPVRIPNEVISYTLLRRRNEASRVPYLMFALQFANVQLQIVLPMHEHDEVLLDGEPFELVPFPNLGGLKEVESQFGRSELRVLDMSGVDRVKGEFERISLKYEQRVELPGNLSL
ncbi:HNH endonuclease [Burkholderia sp. CF099]|nr:HNH endonuclease [Burkholderia sp. CF099]